MVVRKSAVKELVGKDYRISKEFYDALSENVKVTISAAKRRAESNARKTLRPHDL